MSSKKATGIATIDVVRVTVQAGSGPEYVLDTASKVDVSPITEEEKAVPLIIKGILKAQKRATKTLTGNEIKLTDNVFTPELVMAVQGGEILFGTTILGAADAGLAIQSKDPTKPITITIVAPDTVSASLSVNVVSNDITVNLATDSSKVVTSTAALVKTAIDNSVPASALVSVSLVGSGTGLVAAAAKTTVATDIVGYNPPAVGSNSADLPLFTFRAYSAQYNASGTIVQYECIKYPNCQGEPVSLTTEDGKFRAPEYTITSAPDIGQAPYNLTYMTALPAIA